MCTKFQVDWISTSSKTTSTKNFNLKRDGRTDERTNGRTDGRTDAQTRKHNAHKWGIKSRDQQAHELVYTSLVNRNGRHTPKHTNESKLFNTTQG